jgi:hypothetical protein
MSTFDQFDICLAYYHYAIGWGGDLRSCEYANSIARRLAAIKYRPSRSEEYFAALLANENAREIYAAIIQREHSDRCGYNVCACRDCFNNAIGCPDVAMCHDCEDAGCEYGEHECSATEGHTYPKPGASGRDEPRR